MVQGEKAGVTIPAIPTTWEVMMTSATTTPSRDARGSRAEGQGYGLVLFAAILLAVIGCFNWDKNAVGCLIWRRYRRLAGGHAVWMSAPGPADRPQAPRREPLFPAPVA